MKTIEINLYKFSELSEEAKENAIENEIRKGIDTSFYWDEAHQSVKAFHDVFNTREGFNSWLDVRFGYIEDNVRELKGWRLRKYIINNFWSDIHKGKYYSVKANHLIRHKRVKSKTLSNGNAFNAYYSAITIERSCPFTGVCYDMDLLDPIYNLIDWKEDYSELTFEELMENCLDSLRASLESEDDYRNSDEAISEDLEANDYDFTEDGDIY